MAPIAENFSGESAGVGCRCVEGSDITGDISRKTFLHGALGAVAAGALFGSIPASAHPDAPPPTRGEGRTVIPSNVRLRGGNIVCSRTPVGKSWNTLGPTVWAAMWNAWDWEGWIKPQIADLVSVGGNAVRLWGDNQAVIGTAPVMSQDLYFKQWRQLLDYAASLNLYVYACGGSYPTATQAQCVSHYRAWANVLAGYPNVIGVDLINEVWGHSLVAPFVPYATNVAMVQALSDVVRSQGLPVGTSFPLSDPDWWNWGSSDVYAKYPAAPFFEAADMIDIHAYGPGGPHESAHDAIADLAAPGGLTAADLSDTLSQTWAQGKPILLGETGYIAATSDADPNAGAWYENVASVVSSQQQCLGALAWDVYDNLNSPSKYGLFSAPGVPVPNLTVPFGTWPTTR